MADNTFIFPIIFMNKQAISEIINCNKITLRYGLVLSPQEAAELVETQTTALRTNGRIEFGSGVINKIIIKFCDSPFLAKHNYAPILNDLIETFYYFKNETLNEIDDDDLISLMKTYFDQNCRGSIELLQNRELELMARNIRYGIRNYMSMCKDTEESFSEDNYYD
ncbi:DUF6323 family protein [Phosphitispora sp. TUW77]|uniref:DUF6323 family protein n=1 Tax=Phosphitispora sp. TUW77 TaxID=3152361 RepID=UPI003AB49AED